MGCVIFFAVLGTLALLLFLLLVLGVDDLDNQRVFGRLSSGSVSQVRLSALAPWNLIDYLPSLRA